MGSLITQLKIEKEVNIIDQADVSNVDYRFFIADMDSCQAEDVAENSIVESVNLDAKVDFIQATQSSGQVLQRRRGPESQPGPEARTGNGSLTERAISLPGFEFYEEMIALDNAITQQGITGSPYHLDWLTAPRANRGLQAETCTFPSLFSLLFFQPSLVGWLSSVARWKIPKGWTAER